MTPPAALIPVRTGPTAKRRLAHLLSARERTQLVRELLDHVVGVLTDVGMVVTVMSPAPIDELHVQTMRDPAPGLNAAIAASLADADPPVLIVHADLPLLSPQDVESVLADGADVVVARSYDGGTNGLLLRSMIRPAFGPGSALLHAQRARGAALRAAVLDIPGFALDVDDEIGLSACANVSASRYTRP